MSEVESDMRILMGLGLSDTVICSILGFANSDLSFDDLIQMYERIQEEQGSEYEPPII